MLKQELTSTAAKPGLTITAKFRLDWVLALLLGLAFGVRLLVWLIIPHQGFVIDEQEYYDIASVLASGRGWSFYDTATWVRPPLYPLYLAGVLQTFGANLYVMRLGQIGMSVGAIYLLYRITLLNFGRKTALWTLGLAAFAWPFVVFPYLILSETLFLLVFTASIYCITVYFHHQHRNNDTDRFKPRGRQEWIWLVAAGICLGLSGLTRGQILSFIPFVALWLWFGLGRRWKQTMGAFTVIVIFFGLTVAPWAYRNWVSYGRPLLDTTGGYNFYLGSYDGRDGHKVSQDLIQVKNQADRENLGYQLGLQKAASDPAFFIGKGLKDTLAFWQVNFGADERIEKGYTQGEVSPLWMGLDSGLDDIVYIGLAALGLLGLVIAPNKGLGLRSFVAIWTLQNMALAFAFFAVNRFRLPVYFFLLPLAAYVIVNRQNIWVSFKNRFQSHLHKKLKSVLAVIPTLAFLVVVLPPYLSDFPITLPLGINAWMQQEHTRQGDALRLAGDYNGALQQYQQNHTSNPLNTIGTGLTYAALGQYDKAVALISPLNQDIAPTHLALGYIWELQGNQDYARREFESRPVSLDDNNADNWAWNELPVNLCPTNQLNIGAFDWGCINNFHVFQTDKDNGQTVNYRWTDARGDDGQGLSQIRFANAWSGASPPINVSLRLKGYRPLGLTSPSVEVWANGQLMGRVQTNGDWQTFVLKLPPNLSHNDGILTIGLGAPTFVSDATDRRQLGVMLEWVKALP